MSHRLHTLAALSLLLVSVSAQAVRTICNHSKDPVLLAASEPISYQDWNANLSGEWTTSGYTRIEAGSCFQYSANNPNNVYYVVFYAMTEDGQWEWTTGDTPSERANFPDHEICVSTGMANYNFSFTSDCSGQSALLSCENQRGQQTVWGNNVWDGQEWDIEDDYANRRSGSAVSVPGGKKSTPDDSSPPPEISMSERRDRLHKAQQQVKDMQERLTHCDLPGLDAIPNEDITQISSDFLRSQDQCAKEFTKDADEVDKLKKELNDAIAEVLTQIAAVAKATDTALVVAGYNFVTESTSEGLLPVLPPSVYQMDDGSDDFYNTVSIGKFEQEYLIPAVTQGAYIPFLVISHAWSVTFLDMGTRSEFASETTARQMNFLFAVKNFLSYFDQNAVKPPANPVPAEVWATIENDIRPRAPESADQLTLSLKRWTGDQPTADEQLLLSTTLLVGGGYHNLGQSTPAPLISTRLQNLVDSLTASAFSLSSSQAFLARGDLLYSCEMGAAKENCESSGTDLNIFQRLSSGEELTADQPGVQATFFNFFSTLPNPQSAMQDKTKVMDLMKQVVILQ